jgi:uncharacterized protein (DUF305 family)
MYKKSLILTAILSAAVFVACRQPNPTPIDSTQHKHQNQPSSGALSTNANGSVHSQTHETSHREPLTHDEASHSVMKSAPNAAAQPYDVQFLDTMIAHHEGAIEMARAAETKAQNADLKSLAARIIADQTREIAQMKQWREQWFAGKPSALNMEMAGMADSMTGMNMTKINTASGDGFDTEFISQMTPHHQGAVTMAREALIKAEHPEIKTLANQIIQTQEAEIKQMQNWKTQ